MNAILEQRIVQLLHQLDDHELYKVLSYVEAHISISEPRAESPFGLFKGQFEITGDIISPSIPESEWEACQ
ncbi:hypothetical protein GCM10023206_25600 [Acinetobacter puyangensis]|uniref:DUF2281 domain-containing protein n=1 Tax=Acinetobacter puyangensis TaxID=1096779 RepID=A0A240E566_9GAMM|nr:hypothetical protein [Acinetobacter puyangensis]SNX43671.1 hypothetical protein SAMN05421731_101713 [Acinetobacter puyangensis]